MRARIIKDKHLGDPCGITMIRKAARQSFGDTEAPLSHRRRDGRRPRSRRPPSKSAVTSLRATDGNENGRRLSSVMAGVAGALRAEGVEFDTKTLRYFNALSYGRQHQKCGLVNKSGFRNGPLVVKSLVSTSPIYGAPRERAVDCAVIAP